jgi:hypothetical protein
VLAPKTIRGGLMFTRQTISKSTCTFYARFQGCWFWVMSWCSYLALSLNGHQCTTFSYFHSHMKRLATFQKSMTTLQLVFVLGSWTLYTLLKRCQVQFYFFNMTCLGTEKTVMLLRVSHNQYCDKLDLFIIINMYIKKTHIRYFFIHTKL